MSRTGGGAPDEGRTEPRATSGGLTRRTVAWIAAAWIAVALVGIGTGWFGGSRGDSREVGDASPAVSRDGKWIAFSLDSRDEVW